MKLMLQFKTIMPAFLLGLKGLYIISFLVHSSLYLQHLTFPFNQELFPPPSLQFIWFKKSIEKKAEASILRTALGGDHNKDSSPV